MSDWNITPKINAVLKSKLATSRHTFHVIFNRKRIQLESVSIFIIEKRITFLVLLYRGWFFEGGKNEKAHFESFPHKNFQLPDVRFNLKRVKFIGLFIFIIESQMTLSVFL